MDMISKVALMGVLQSPMWKLSPDQLTRIEAILDGARVPHAKPAAPTILSYEEAAERLGLRAKNRAKTVALWVRLGKLDALMKRRCVRGKIVAERDRGRRRRGKRRRQRKRQRG